MQALVDSGATYIFIDKIFVDRHYLNTYKLSKPVLVYNVDRTPNKVG